LETRPPTRGLPSMPPSHLPVEVAVMLAVASRVPAHVATLFAALPQEHERGLGGWHDDWESLPEICILTGSSLQHALTLLDVLRVTVGRMRQNLDATRGLVLAERVALMLAQQMERGAATELLARACRSALEKERPLRNVLARDRVINERIAKP